MNHPAQVSQADVRTPNADALETCRAHIAGIGQRPAIILTGSWGIGKSWFVESRLKSVVQESGSRFLLVSVNGIIDEQRIYDEIIDAFDSQNPQRRRWWSTCWQWGVKWWRRCWHRGATIAIRSAGIEDDHLDSAIHGMAVSQKRKATAARLASLATALVIDDVERLRLPYQEFFAIVSRFISLEKCRVFLVCSEDAPLEPDALQAYRAGKEKCCSIAIAIETEAESFLTSAISALNPESTRQFVEIQTHYLRRLVHETENLSLRQVKAALMLFAVADEALTAEITRTSAPKPGDHQRRKLQELRVHLFRCVLALHIESRRTEQRPGAIADIVRRQTNFLLRVDKHKKEREFYDQFALRYFEGRESLEHIPVYAVQLVESGKTDRMAIRKDVADIMAVSLNTGEAAIRDLRGYSVVSRENAQAQAELTSALAMIELGRVTDLNDFIRAATKLHYFAEQGITAEPAEAVRQVILKGVSDTIFSVGNDFSNQLSDYNDNIPFNRDLHAAMTQRAEQLLVSNAATHIKQAFSEGGIMAAASIAGNKDDQYFRHPLLIAIPPEEFWKFYPQLTNEQREALQGSLRFRLRYGGSRKAMEAERPWFEQSVAILKQQEVDVQSVAAYHLRNMIATLQSAIPPTEKSVESTPPA